MIFGRYQRRWPPFAKQGLGPGFFLLAFRFELRELLRGQDTFCLLHELGLGCLRAPRFVVFGHRRVHLRLLIWGQVETRK